MIELIAETADTVTLRRADYDAMTAELEDARDLAAIREAEARVAAGKDEYVPMELVDRLIAGEHPVRVWRAYRGMKARALADAAGIPASYLSEIEAGRKPGSARTLAALAKVLRVDIEDLLQPSSDER